MVDGTQRGVGGGLISDHGRSLSELPSDRHGFSVVGQLPNKQGEFECYAL